MLKQRRQRLAHLIAATPPATVNLGGVDTPWADLPPAVQQEVMKNLEASEPTPASPAPAPAEAQPQTLSPAEEKIKAKILADFKAKGIDNPTREQLQEYVQQHQAEIQAQGINPWHLLGGIIKGLYEAVDHLMNWAGSPNPWGR